MRTSPEFMTPVDCHRENPSGRDRMRVGAELAVAGGVVYIISLLATVYFCLSMSGGMDMPGDWTMSMMWMRMPGQTWLESAAMFLLMWVAMMVAMMLPSALPMLLSFRRSLGEQRDARADVSTALAACGYFTVWTAIGVGVYVVGVLWAFATMRWTDLSRAVPCLTGVALVLAGAFQFSRWKMAGLGHCQNTHVRSTYARREGVLAGWTYGFRQGLFCGTCCSGLMTVLLVLGTMNPLVMLMVAIVISLEKLLPKSQTVVRFTGIVAVCSGIAIVLRSLFQFVS